MAADTNPLAALPPPVADSIFSRLPLPALGAASLACAAWRSLPYQHGLPESLPIQSAAGILSAPGCLQRCRWAALVAVTRSACHSLTPQPLLLPLLAPPPPQHDSNVRSIRVSSSNDALWPVLAAALCRHRLPALRELHLQHSSQTDAAQLVQLRSILQVHVCVWRAAGWFGVAAGPHPCLHCSCPALAQVQGPGCALHLALTDKASLQALLPLLPIQGLASLELNVPFLADGMDALLLRAATIQASALHDCDDSSQQHQQHYQRLCVSVWVCAWSGCPGVALQDALHLHTRLQQVPRCVMTGCEAIKVANAADVAALQQLAGLEALGIVFVGKQQQHYAVAAEDGGEDAGSMAAGLAAALRAGSSGLRQLNLRGSPSCGWGLAPGLAQHPLAGLTSITKLSLLKDFSPQPLPLQEVAQLVQLQELALERVQLGSCDELACLGALTSLRVLSLVLTVQADELLDSQGPASQPWEEQAAAEAVADSLGQLALRRGDACWCCRRVFDAGACAADLHAQVCACSAGVTTSPALIQWDWMRRLSRLETAWLQVRGWVSCLCLSLPLPVFACCCSECASAHRSPLLTRPPTQVPHIDLACLPSSLVELDAQQPHDAATCSITCDARGVCLPNLRLLVLPRPLVQGAAGGNDEDSDEETDSDSDEALAVRLHHEAGLLLAIVGGCAQLRELELMQWAPPPAALLAAATELADLRRLSCCAVDVESPDEVVRQCAAAREALRLRPCGVAVQEQLVLSSYPWSRVLAAR
jgi:hypothetical protein